ARRFSQDPGSATSGGDVGFFTRERMVKEFSDTSFALPVGGVSQPVKTRFGYHIIKVDEKKPAGVRPFEEVRSEIRMRLAPPRGDYTTRRRAMSIRREIARGGDPRTLGNAAGAFVTSPEFAAQEPVPGLGFSPELSEDLAHLPLDKWSPKVYRISNL